MHPPATSRPIRPPGRAAAAGSRRRWPARAAAAAGLLSVVASVAVLGAWAASRWLTDEHYLTQFMFWVPTWGYLAVAGALLLPALLLRPERGGSVRRWLRRAGAGALLGALVYAVVVEDRRLAWVWPAGAASGARGSTLALLHWNMECPDAVGFVGSIPGMLPALPREPDVVVVSNYQSLAEFGRSIREWPGLVHRVAAGRFRVASRWPIASVRTISVPPAAAPTFAGSGTLRRAMQGLFNRYNAGAQPEPRRFNPASEATLVWVTLAPAADGSALPTSSGAMVICLVDLPSDPLSPRAATARAVARAAREAEPPLPPPLLWIGDFNTPFGSASLGVIAPGSRHAREMAPGAPAGHVASWPRLRPLLHIDHALLAGGLTAREYRLLVPAMADHRAQWVVVGRP